MKVLIIGNGGREHAIAWKVAQSPLVSEIFVAPGNGGTAHEPKTTNVNISATDIPALIDFAKQNNIGLTIVGPEAPLAAGIVDQFSANHLACFGPTQAATQLESSKTFCKDFLLRHHIPTASYASFEEPAAAIDYLKSQQFPIVIKADGLAAGKGVVIAEDFEQAQATVNDMLSGSRHGTAGERIIIEEFLQGEEVSFIAMVDGKHVLALATSQDHKALQNGDKGPNTGGMGAYSPAPIVTPELHHRIMQEVMQPTVLAMAKEDHPYRGFLYAGLMISDQGVPNVLEFNCRLGDPETQPLLMRLKSDLAELCIAALNAQLDQYNLDWDPRPALGVVLAAGGYPGDYQKGDIISGLPAQKLSEQKVFHAGTISDDGTTKTAGGRVLCVTALGDNIQSAQASAYELVKTIHWNNMFYRTDIGHKAIERYG